jgi:tripartite-type tricarboxylate transporter receptor subunit TctC
VHKFLLAASLALAAQFAWAQAFPVKPVRLIVGYAPGGAVDANARLFAPRLSEILGQQVIVDNKPGAAAQIATDFVAKSAPDGHTILLTAIGHAITPSLYRKLPYDTLADFANVTQTTAASMLLVVSGKVQAGNLMEFLAQATAKPGSLNYGSPGIADALGFAMELLKHSAGINIVPIQYKGAGPVYTALLAGEVDVAFVPTSQSLGYLSSGKLRALAVGSPRRISVLPDVPTVAEAGVPGFEMVNWQGMFVPVRTPPAVVRQIQAAVARTLSHPEVRDRLVASGLEAVASTPEEFDAKVRSDIAKFAKVVREARLPLLD